MNRKKKILSLLLLIALILNIIPSKVFAADPPNMSEIYKLVTDVEHIPMQRDVAVNLANKILAQGYDLWNTHSPRQYVNVYVYQKYDIVVYGERHGTYKAGEYRYLGYDITGYNHVTNDEFPYDYDTNPTVLQRIWRVVPNAYPQSWNIGSARFTEVKKYMLHRANLINGSNADHSPHYTNHTLEYTMGAAVDDPTKDSDIMPRILVQSPPNLISNGSVRCEFKSRVDGGIHYDTFVIPPLDFDFEPIVTATTDKTNYVVGPDTPSVTVKVTPKVSFSVNNMLNIGRSPESMVNTVRFKVNNHTPVMAVNPPSIAASNPVVSPQTFDVVFWTKDLSDGPNTRYIDVYGDIGTIYRDYNDQISTVEFPNRSIRVAVTITKQSPIVSTNLDLKVTSPRMRLKQLTVKVIELLI